ncbi:MAG: sialidase family protein, partial [Candidatus Latescibacteria bacterium]|nr:sialidase family protein [Candidatus Latescibacterota bacterium]
MVPEKVVEVWHHEKVELCGPELDHPMASGGSTVRLADGRVLLTYAGPANPHGQPLGTNRVYMRTSGDGGRTWSAEQEIIHHPECNAGGATILRDRDGTLWAAYLGFYASVWDKDINEPDMEKTRSDLWIARSVDEGETWIDNKMVFRGYTGATNDFKQAASGHLIAPFSYVVPKPGRLVSACVVSADGGATWTLGDAI